MSKLIDAIVSAAIVFSMTAGANRLLKESFLLVRRAALEKAAQGLPKLPSFGRGGRLKHHHSTTLGEE